MLQHTMGILIAAAFLISPLLIIKYLLNYSDKHPQRVIDFHFKIPGCNVALTLSDENEKAQQDKNKDNKKPSVETTQKLDSQKRMVQCKSSNL